MACEKRYKTCECEHVQCEYSEETGVGCVNVIDDYCQHGFYCVRNCDYSYTGNRAYEIAKELFRDIPEIEEV